MDEIIQEANGIVENQWGKGEKITTIQRAVIVPDRLAARFAQDLDDSIEFLLQAYR